MSAMRVQCTAPTRNHCISFGLQTDLINSHPTSTLAKEDTSHMFGLKQQQQVHRQLGWKDNATVYAMTASPAGDCSVSGCHSPFQGLISH